MQWPEQKWACALQKKYAILNNWVTPQYMVAKTAGTKGDSCHLKISFCKQRFCWILVCSSSFICSRQIVDRHFKIISHPFICFSQRTSDVFELIRARSNKIQALPGEIDHIYLNLPSGYFRDMQIIKESFLPVFTEMNVVMSNSWIFISTMRKIS